MVETAHLKIMLGMIVMVALIELVVGYYGNSILLITDSFHMVSDGLAIGIVMYIIWFKNWKEKPFKNSYGWERTDVFGSYFNGVFLLTVCVVITLEAVNRLFHVKPMNDPWLVLIVAFIGFIVNVIGMALFGHGHGHSVGDVESLEAVAKKSHGELCDPSDKTCNQKNNDPKPQGKDDVEKEKEEEMNDIPMKKQGHNHSQSQSLGSRALYLHVLADAFGSLVVMISAVLVITTDWTFIDYVEPCLSFMLVFIIVFQTIPVVRESHRILNMDSPSGVDMTELKKEILQLKGVISLHNMLIWGLTEEFAVSQVHVVAHPDRDHDTLMQEIKDIFQKHNINCSTTQIEVANRPVIKK